MLTAFQKLAKILKLEESQGFRDRAVIGGFAKFARIWQSEAQADARDADTHRARHRETPEWAAATSRWR